MAKKGTKFRHYTEDFKQQAVHMYEQKMMSYAAVAKELGIPSSTPIKNWVKKFRNGESFMNRRGKTSKKEHPFKGRPRTRFQSVEEERDYLKAQVDYLKKRYQNLYGEEDSQK